MDTATRTLTQLRLDAGLSIDRLAALIGVTPKTISNIEKGRNRNPGIDVGGRHAAALGISLDEYRQLLEVAA